MSSLVTFPLDYSVDERARFFHDLASWLWSAPLRELFADLLHVEPEQVVAGGSSSLVMMREVLVDLVLKGGVDSERPWGWQEPVDWANYERWMRAEGLLKQPPSEAPPLTNEFLPGEGLGESARG